jgi:nucleotide-binding universal stress UspA family protein
MSDAQVNRPFAILLCFDDTDASGYAFDEAARLAKRIPSSEIHLVYVNSGEASAERTEHLVGQFRAYVDAKAASIGDMEGQAVAVHVRNGKPVREIVQLAAEIDADLLVIGSPKHPHLASFIPGSVQEGLVQHAPCSIIVAGPKPPEPRVHFPAIEPPCPDCHQVRTESHGQQWWCARHQAGLAAHTYSYQGEIPFAARDTAVDPTGSFA